MNPVLLKHLSQHFFSDYIIPYSGLIDELRVANKSNKEYEPSTEKMSHFSDIVNVTLFHTKYNSFIKNYEITGVDLAQFINDTILNFRERVVQIESLFDDNENKIKEYIWMVSFLHTYQTTEIIKYLEYELKKLSESGVENLDDAIIRLVAKPKYTWDNKTELSQLIHVLFKSNRIKKDGNPIQKKELSQLTAEFFNINSFEPSDYINKSAKSYKSSTDGKTFISELNQIMTSYIKEINIKEGK